MNVTVNNVTAKVEWEGFRKARLDTGPVVVTRYQVAYADADAFADGVLGGFVKSGGSGGTVTNVPRMKCPTNPSLYALSAEVEYAGERDDVGGVITFESASVVVTFGNLTWPQAFTDDPGGEQSFQLESQPNQPILNAECEIDHGGQLVTMPTGSLVFVSDGKKVDFPMTKWEGIDVWRVVRHNFPNLPYAKVRSLKNRVNNSTFLGQARGLVRFANARSSGVMTGQGFKCQRFEMVFEVKDQDWNDFIRPDDLAYDTVAGAADNTKFPYHYTDDLPTLLA